MKTKRPTVVVIAGPNGAGKSTAAPFLADCQAQGYRVELFYIAIPSAELAVNRVALRVKLGGHHVPTSDVHRRFQRSLQNLFELYLPLADRWTVIMQVDY